MINAAKNQLCYLLDVFTTKSSLIGKADKREFRWQVALSVLGLFIIGSILNIPFSREVKRLIIDSGVREVKLNEFIINDIMTIGLSSLILGLILCFVGFWVSSKTNLGAPVLTNVFATKSFASKSFWRAIISSLIITSLVAFLLLGLFELIKEFYPVTNKVERPSKKFYAIVSFSAGISEEIIYRLGLMSIIVASIQFFKQVENPSQNIVWTAIIISALFFGIVHLPLSSNFVELTFFTVGVTMLGNLITGILFGWIFWKHGLLVAIVSHVAFDLIFHVIGSPYN